MTIPIRAALVATLLPVAGAARAVVPSRGQLREMAGDTALNCEDS